MKKRKISLLALLICLLLSLPVSAAAKKDGWHKASNGVVYYYKNGKIAKGFVKIKNKTCYFNKKGKLVKNAWVIYKGKKYRADRCGTIKKNCFVKVDGKFYSLKADGSVRKGWQNVFLWDFLFWQGRSHSERAYSHQRENVSFQPERNSSHRNPDGRKDHLLSFGQRTAGDEEGFHRKRNTLL